MPLRTPTPAPSRAGPSSSRGSPRPPACCVVADNSVWVFVLQFAAMRLGAIFVPLNWRLSLGELAILGADCSPALVVHDVVWAERGRELAAKIAAPTVGFGAADDPEDLG